MTEQTTKAQKSRTRRVFSLLFGILLVLAVVRLTGMSDLSGIEHVELPIMLLACFVISIMMSLFSFRWFVVIKGLLPDSSTNFSQLYHYSMSSIVASNLFAQTASAIVVRSASLNQHDDISLKASIGTVVVDKLFDVFLLLLYFPILVLNLLGFISADVAFILAVVISFLTILLVYFYYQVCMNLLQSLLNLGVVITSRIPFLKRLMKLDKLKDAQDYMGNSTSFLEKAPLIRALGISFLGQFLLVTRSWLIAQSVGLDIPFAWVFLGVILTQASLFIAITPGGLGIMEGAWFLVFASLGLTDASVGLFLLLQRFLTLVVSIILYLGSKIIGWYNGHI